jgi:hypothetical protein
MSLWLSFSYKPSSPGMGEIEILSHSALLN